MNKLIKEGTLALLVGTLIYWGLSQINFMKIMKLDESKGNVFEQLGKFYIEDLEKTTHLYNDSLSLNFLDTLKTRICLSNQIDTSNLKIYLFEHEVFNAYALPGRRIVLNSELIRFSENADEVAAVLAHELAHIELNHVKKNVVSQMTIQILIAAASGTINSTAANGIAELGFSKYSRVTEQEADNKALEYLQNANINPIHMVNLFNRMAKELEAKDEHIIDFEFLSSHPETKKRAAEIKSKIKEKQHFTPTYDPTAFKYLQNKLTNGSQQEAKEIREVYIP